MADLAFAAAGWLPVCLKLPVPLQQPYAADSGTLTEWLVVKTANLGRDAALAVLAAMNAKYANLVDPLLTQERVNAMLSELAEDVLASEGLESFLTVTTPGRNADGHYRFEIVPILQRNGTDIPVRWECVWFPRRG